MSRGEEAESIIQHRTFDIQRPSRESRNAEARRVRRGRDRSTGRMANDEGPKEEAKGRRKAGDKGQRPEIRGQRRSEEDAFTAC